MIRRFKLPNVGARYGRWTIVAARVGRTRRGETLARVRCDCGQVRDRKLSEIRGGRSTCCGCRRTRQGKFSDVNHQTGGKLDRFGDQPRIIRGAEPTPGGTLLPPEVVAFMRRHGVTRIERVEVEP